MQDLLKESDISLKLDEIATRVDLSPYHFSSTFLKNSWCYFLYQLIDNEQAQLKTLV